MVTLSSCTHNNGDIGPYFGTWKLLSISVDGVEDVDYAGNVFWKFQNEVVCMVRVNESAHTANECWGTWKEIGNVMQLNHTHWDDNHKQGSFYYSPLPETHLPANSISDLEIVSLSGSSMQLKYVTDDNRVVGYKFTKW